MDRVEIYKDAAGEWRWKRKAPNNKTVSDSGEGYKSKSYAIRAARRQNPDADIPAEDTDSSPEGDDE